MNKTTDQAYLKDKQYRTPDNLLARINLHRLYGTNPQGWQHWVFGQLSLQPGMTILDVGCGPSHLWRENSQYLNDVKLFLGDLSLGMLQESLKALGFSGCYGINLDAQYLPYSRSQFDVVVANHMLYHLPDLEKGIAEIVRVLKPSGKFIAATNGKNHLKELRTLFLNCLGGDLSLYDVTRSFSLENGKSILRDHFGHVEIKIFPEDLRVKESSPLMDYICSMWEVEDGLTEEKLEKMWIYVDEVIEKQGYFLIHKSQGLFVATQPVKE